MPSRRGRGLPRGGLLGTCTLALAALQLAQGAGAAPTATSKPRVNFDANATRPHVAFVVMDDTGYNDVGFTGLNSSAKTPNLDWLAAQGMVLSNFYVAPICSPTRSMFLTGRYTHHTGMQHDVIGSMEPWCVPPDETFLMQRMQLLNYSTHVIGKWHLGYARPSCTPPFRGADTFYGYYMGAEDHFTHDLSLSTLFGEAGINASCYYGGVCPKAIDLHRATLPFTVATPDFGQAGNYSAHIFTTEAEHQIAAYARNHSSAANQSANPFFLYLAYQNNHSPLQVPAEYMEAFRHITHIPRRIFLGMVAALDEGIGNVSNALRENHMLEKTLWVVAADNGGQVRMGGNNYPLRGGKLTLWEGGVRVPAFISGYGVPKKGVTTALLHATDIYPTLIELGGGITYDQLKPLDGYSMLDHITTGAPMLRGAAVLQYDALASMDSRNSAGYCAMIIRYNITHNITNSSSYSVLSNMKIILNPFDGIAKWTEDGWFPEQGSGVPADMDASLHQVEVHEQVANYSKSIWGHGTPLHDSIYVFNLTADPYEHTNLAQAMYNQVNGTIYGELLAAVLGVADGNPQYRTPCFMEDGCGNSDASADPRYNNLSFPYFAPWLPNY